MIDKQIDKIIITLISINKEINKTLYYYYYKENYYYYYNDKKVRKELPSIVEVKYLLLEKKGKTIAEYIKEFERKMKKYCKFESIFFDDFNYEEIKEEWNQKHE